MKLSTYIAICAVATLFVSLLGYAFGVPYLGVPLLGSTIIVSAFWVYAEHSRPRQVSRKVTETTRVHYARKVRPKAPGRSGKFTPREISIGAFCMCVGIVLASKASPKKAATKPTPRSRSPDETRGPRPHLRLVVDNTTRKRE